MMRRFLMWLSARLPVDVIDHQGKPYLERYYVATVFGYWRVYLHRFVGSDPDGLHVHPWEYGVSLILVNRYIEQRRFGYYDVRWVNIVNGDTMHRVILLGSDKKPEQVWSLFIHSPKRGNWGFLRKKYPGKSLIQIRPVTVFEEAGEDRPLPHSGWYRTAPKGRDIRRAA